MAAAPVACANCDDEAVAIACEGCEGHAYCSGERYALT